MFKALCLLGVLSTCTLSSAPLKVLAFAGSNREDSVNRKLILEAARIAERKGADVTLINLKDYPIAIYEGDFEAKEGMPANAKFIRNQMMNNQVVMIASPEFNGSISALLKNVLDWASRDEKGGSSRDAYKGKKFVLLSASPGGGGGNRGLVHLRSVVESVGGTVLSEQMTLANAFGAFNEQGQLKDSSKEQELERLIDKALN